MERGHYVAFINVGPNLKVRKSRSLGTLKFQEGDINVACDELFKNVGIVLYVWLFCLILGAHFFVQLNICLNFLGRMGVKWRDLSKFTLPLEKGSYFYFPLLLIQ